MFEGAPFQGASVDASDFFTWQVPGVSPEARHRFARNTCNGCHTPSETGGAEFQVRPRFPFQEAQLSGFLTGADVIDFNAGVIRHFNELGRRGRILHDLVCPQEVLPPPPPETTPIGGGMGGPEAAACRRRGRRRWRHGRRRGGRQPRRCRPTRKLAGRHAPGGHSHGCLGRFVVPEVLGRPGDRRWAPLATRQTTTGVSFIH